MNFRKGIGAIILNSKRKIIGFQRSDYRSNWQAPEGGLEGEETEIDGIYRELNEEVGITKDDVILLSETKDFYRYYFAYPNKFGQDGQDKKFFLFKLKDDNFEFKFDTKKDEIEFSDYKEFDGEELLKVVPPFKKLFYKKILTEFRLL